jgi:hypothetical protein
MARLRVVLNLLRQESLDHDRAASDGAGDPTGVVRGEEAGPPGDVLRRSKTPQRTHLCQRCLLFRSLLDLPVARQAFEESPIDPKDLDCHFPSKEAVGIDLVNSRLVCW